MYFAKILFTVESEVFNNYLKPFYVWGWILGSWVIGGRWLGPELPVHIFHCTRRYLFEYMKRSDMISAVITTMIRIPFPFYIKLSLLISLNSLFPSAAVTILVEFSTILLKNLIFFYASSCMSFWSIDQGKGFISFLFYLADLCVIF